MKGPEKQLGDATAGPEHCPACGYPRSGRADTGVCPECGSSLEWFDEHYYIADLPMKERAALRRRLMFVLVGAGGVLAALLIAGTRWKWLPDSTALLYAAWAAGAIGAGAAGWGVLCLTRREHGEPEPYGPERERIIARATGAGCLIALAGAAVMRGDPYVSLSVLLAVVFATIFAWSFGIVLAEIARRAREPGVAGLIRRSSILIAVDGLVVLLTILIAFVFSRAGARILPSFVLGVAGIGVLLWLYHAALYTSRVRMLGAALRRIAIGADRR